MASETPAPSARSRDAEIAALNMQVELWIRRKDDWKELAEKAVRSAQSWKARAEAAESEVTLLKNKIEELDNLITELQERDD